ncbi:hypothetical protein [Ruegeria sp. EL01]|jgi:hypothetical protein|uniref:hypothetical protein n=1 Tax=Ruegeria sp. EL01 TaxID=2107578 RepID=UPI000EA82CB0|nr:hypothetical protein [Ruegeria sp. EL01]
MAFLKKIRPSLLRPNNRGWRTSLLAFVLLAPGGVVASTVADVLNNAQLRGDATFRFLGLSVYDAKLYTPQGAPFNWSQDFGLLLRYRKNLKQKALVESTLEEMDRQGNGAPVQNQLEQCFQSVSKGDTYLAVSRGPDKVAFWRNGTKTCTLSYPGIKRAFMSIFLGNNTRSARFTRQLKGQ